MVEGSRHTTSENRAKLLIRTLILQLSLVLVFTTFSDAQITAKAYF